MCCIDKIIIIIIAQSLRYMHSMQHIIAKATLWKYMSGNGELGQKISTTHFHKVTLTM